MGVNANPIEARVYEFDFAVDGGAVGDITLRGAPGDLNAGKSGGFIPAGAVVLDAIVHILEDLTGDATTTVAVDIPGIGNIAALENVDPATLDAGEVFLVREAEGAVTELAAAAKPSLNIAVQDLTAGKLRVTVFYVNEVPRS